MFAKKENKSKKKLYLAAAVILIAIIVMLGTKDIPNETQEIAIDITEQVKAKK